jgi:hypothetical protein
MGLHAVQQEIKHFWSTETQTKQTMKSLATHPLYKRRFILGATIAALTFVLFFYMLILTPTKKSIDESIIQNKSNQANPAVFFDVSISGVPVGIIFTIFNLYRKSSVRIVC